MSTTIKYTIDDFIKEKLQHNIKKMEHLENGNLYEMVIKIVEESLLKVVLNETKGNQSRASDILGINRNTIRKKIKEFNIDLGSVEI